MMEHLDDGYLTMEVVTADGQSVRLQTVSPIREVEVETEFIEYERRDFDGFRIEPEIIGEWLNIRALIYKSHADSGVMHKMTVTPPARSLEAVIGAAIDGSQVGHIVTHQYADALKSEIIEALRDAGFDRAAPRAGVTLHLGDERDDLKAIREALCLATSAIGYLQAERRTLDASSHIERIGRIIDEIDRQRPLGSDGTHGDRHTLTCGCDRS